MNPAMAQARDNFIQGISRITGFWGLPKTMGATYAAIYLSPQPISLDDLVAQLGISKGSVSTNVRSLERLGMVQKHFQIGDRKDYYEAEINFWKIIKDILKEREKVEFDHALRSVTESLALLKEAKIDNSEVALADFYKERLAGMKSFFDNLDNLVSMIIALDELRTGTIGKLFGKTKES